MCWKIYIHLVEYVCISRFFSFTYTQYLGVVGVVPVSMFVDPMDLWIS